MRLSRSQIKQHIVLDLLEGVADGVDEAYRGGRIPAKVKDCLARLRRWLVEIRSRNPLEFDDDKQRRRYGRFVERVTEVITASWGPELDAREYINSVLYCTECVREELPGRDRAWTCLAKALQSLYRQLDPELVSEDRMEKGQLVGESIWSCVSRS